MKPKKLLHNLLGIYKGNNVKCCICGAEYKKFASYGNVKRANAKCLNCNSLERHRLVWKYLNDKTDLLSDNNQKKLLHFAPENLFFKMFIKQKNIEYYPCDLYPEKFDYQIDVKVNKADITNIPFDDNSFDVILCNHVLEHIPDDRLAMRELNRVMKKDGWAILQVPIDYNREKTYEDFSITHPKQKKKAFGHKDHVRWYGRDYKDRLAQSGFKVKEDDYVKSFSADEIFRYGFTDSEMIYYCEK